jgi:hypothetical protein
MITAQTSEKLFQQIVGTRGMDGYFSGVDLSLILTFIF